MSIIRNTYQQQKRGVAKSRNQLTSQKLLTTPPQHSFTCDNQSTSPVCQDCFPDVNLR